MRRNRNPVPSTAEDENWTSSVTWTTVSSSMACLIRDLHLSVARSIHWLTFLWKCLWKLAICNCWRCLHGEKNLVKNTFDNTQVHASYETTKITDSFGMLFLSFLISLIALYISYVVTASGLSLISSLDMASTTICTRGRNRFFYLSKLRKNLKKLTSLSIMR